jgi:Flp pilus assembly protein TadD
VIAFGLALALALPGSGDEGSPCPKEAPLAARQEAALLLEAGPVAIQAGRFDEGERALQDAARLDPASPFAHYALGAALLERRPSDAVAAFLRCRDALRCLRESDPERQARFRAEIDAAIESSRNALLELERDRLKKAAIPWQEMNRDAKPTLGQTAPVIMALEQRIIDLQRLRRNPDREPPNLPVALGRAHFGAGSLDEAEREFRQALRLDENHGDAHNNLAVVLMLQGRLEEAEREVKAAEKAGVDVAQRLKDEIRSRKRRPRGAETGTRRRA